jgi:hypothetical protein
VVFLQLDSRTLPHDTISDGGSLPARSSRRSLLKGFEYLFAFKYVDCFERFPLPGDSGILRAVAVLAHTAPAAQPPGLAWIALAQRLSHKHWHCRADHRPPVNQGGVQFSEHLLLHPQKTVAK